MTHYRQIGAGLIAVCMAVAADAAGPHAQDSHPAAESKLAAGASPVYGVELPVGYRQWELVSVAYEAPFDEFRGILGNPVALAAYREGTLPFPDGSILVKLAWKREASSDFDGAFIAGAATTVQVMVKDSRRYPASGGWGFGRFVKGIPADETEHIACFGCHYARVRERDFVFTRLAP